MDRAKRLSWVLVALVLLLLLTLANWLIFLKIHTYDDLESYLDKKEQEYHLQVAKDGSQGIQSIQGVQGVEGPKGDKGDQGVQGVPGVQGPQGEQGVQGETGEKGDKGDTGEAGKTPLIRCNITKNVWQIRYSEDEAWQTMGTIPTKCVAN